MIRKIAAAAGACVLLDQRGAGVRSGKYELGLRLQHISNGGARHPNPGINFLLMRLQYEL